MRDGGHTRWVFEHGRVPNLQLEISDSVSNLFASLRLHGDLSRKSQVQDIIQALDVPRKLRNNTTSCALQQTGSVERANVPMLGRLIVDLIVEKQKTPQIIDFTGFFANPGGERAILTLPFDNGFHEKN